MVCSDACVYICMWGGIDVHDMYMSLGDYDPEWEGGRGRGRE